MHPFAEEYGVAQPVGPLGGLDGEPQRRPRRFLSLKSEDLLDASGALTVEAILARGIDEVRDLTTGAAITTGVVTIQKKLRPNWRDDRGMLFVGRVGDGE